MSEGIFSQLSEAIVKGNIKKSLELTEVAVNQGLPIKDIIQKGLTAGIRTVGDLFNKGDYFLPELIVSGKAIQSALDYLKLKFGQEKETIVGNFLIGTVKGDIHDIGKNIVTMMLKSNGWEVTDLGVDISPEQFCNAVKNNNFDVLGMSSLLTMTMPNLDETIKALEKAALREKIKIIIGGAPVTQEYADRIGADAYGKDAWDAVIKAESLKGKIWWQN
jgi:5-methyltetrahydrofolate--homocysteine methyltransferase